MPRYKKKPAGTPRRLCPPGPPGLAAYPRASTVRRIAEIMSLGYPLSRVCQMPGMPTVDLVMKWQRKDADIRRVFQEARAIGADAIAEQCIDIADEATNETVKVARLRISTRLRLLPSWAPQTYGKPEQQMSAQPQVILNFAQILSSPDAANVVIKGASPDFHALEEGGQE